MLNKIQNLKHKPNFKWFTEKKRDKSTSVPVNPTIEVKAEGSE